MNFDQLLKFAYDTGRTDGTGEFERNAFEHNAELQDAYEAGWCAGILDDLSHRNY